MTPEERAQTAREILFRRYDELNALWQQAEEQLTQFHIPRPVYHMYDEYPDPDEPRAKIRKYLALQKIRGKWRICAGLEYEEFPDREDWTTITECSAQVRVEAVRHLDKLRAKVIQSAEDFIPKVEEAIKILAAAIGHHTNAESQTLATERAKLNGQHS